MVVKGFSKVFFGDVVSAKIQILPLRNGEFVKLYNGDNLKFRREWNLDKMNDSLVEYEFDGSIFFPYGSCVLKIYSKGEVFVEFESSDVYDYYDYICNPDKRQTFWGYLNDVERCTNSLIFEEVVKGKS